MCIKLKFPKILHSWYKHKLFWCYGGLVLGNFGCQGCLKSGLALTSLAQVIRLGYWQCGGVRVVVMVVRRLESRLVNMFRNLPDGNSALVPCSTEWVSLINRWSTAQQTGTGTSCQFGNNQICHFLRLFPNFAMHNLTMLDPTWSVLKLQNFSTSAWQPSNRSSILQWIMWTFLLRPWAGA